MSSGAFVRTQVAGGEVRARRVAMRCTRAQPDLDAGRHFAGRRRKRTCPARLDLLIHEIRELDAALLVAGRVHVGQVVRNVVDVALLGIHARRRRVESANHLKLLLPTRHSAVGTRHSMKSPNVGLDLASAECRMPVRRSCLTVFPTVRSLCRQRRSTSDSKAPSAWLRIRGSPAVSVTPAGSTSVTFELLERAALDESSACRRSARRLVVGSCSSVVPSSESRLGSANVTTLSACRPDPRPA